MAGPGSGLGSSFGTGIEAGGSYGTPGTVNKWMAVDSAEFKRAPVYFKGSGLRGGTLVRDSNDRVLTNQDATGTVKTNQYRDGMNRFVGSLMGTLGTAPTQYTTSGYYTSISGWSNSWQQSFNIEQGIPDIAQTVHRWVTYGCKVSEAQFECSAGNPLLSSWTIDAQDHFEPVGAITNPTEPINNPFFSFATMKVLVGTVGLETKVDGVRKWTGTYKRMRDDKRFNAGNLTTNPNLSYVVKDEPVDNNFADISGTLETEYLNDTLYENYFQTESPFSLVISFTLGTSLGNLTAGTLPTVTPTGGTGSTPYFYKIVARSITGGTVPSAEGTTATGVASLTATSYNALSWTAVPNAVAYDIWRGSTTGNETTLVAAWVTGTTYNDIGTTVGTGTCPASNTASVQPGILFVLPRNFFTGEDPTVNGPDLVKPNMPFETWLINDGFHSAAIIATCSTEATA